MEPLYKLQGSHTWIDPWLPSFPSLTSPILRNPHFTSVNQFRVSPPIYGTCSCYINNFLIQWLILSSYSLTSPIPLHQVSNGSLLPTQSTSYN